MERVTTGESAQAQQGTPGRTKTGDRLLCITGATGIETTVLPQHGANRCTIETNQIQQQDFHGEGVTCSSGSVRAGRIFWQRFATLGHKPLSS